jgi:hypothetical protein
MTRSPFHLFIENFIHSARIGNAERLLDKKKILDKIPKRIVSAVQLNYENIFLRLNENSEINNPVEFKRCQNC